MKTTATTLLFAATTLFSSLNTAAGLGLPPHHARNTPHEHAARKSCSTALGPPSSAGKLTYAGINIAGFDFGCNTEGWCPLNEADPPLASLGHADGIGQMKHFYSVDGFNVFRLPVSWQYLVNDVYGGGLNSAKVAEYDELMQGCLATGAHCLLDIHNYARWNGGVVGQGGPTNTMFVNFWTALATKYKSSSRVVFGLMNEPHDLTSFSDWKNTLQLVVTGIRNAGATSQIILLGGTDYMSAGAFVSSGAASSLMNIKNPDGTTTNLIFDVHQYLDSDGSGTSSTCVTNNIDSFKPLVQWLRCNGRRAFLTETGGGNTNSCVTYVKEQLAYMAGNSDVFLGFIGWAAGSFSTSYALSATPTVTSSTWLNAKIVNEALKLYVP